MRRVSAADANRQFSQLLKEVKGGEFVTVTSRGEAVAVIGPASAAPASARNRAKEVLLARLRGQTPAGVTWTRDELYGEDA